MSFLKCIVKADTEMAEQWLLNPDAAFRMMTDSEIQFAKFI